MSGLRWRWAFKKDWYAEPEKKILDPYRHQDLIELGNKMKQEVFCSNCRWFNSYETCKHPSFREKENSPLGVTIRYPSVHVKNKDNDCLFHEGKWHKRVWDWFTR